MQCNVLTDFFRAIVYVNPRFFIVITFFVGDTQGANNTKQCKTGGVLTFFMIVDNPNEFWKAF